MRSVAQPAPTTLSVALTSSVMVESGLRRSFGGVILLRAQRSRAG
eukprot:CAMPEP_0185505336 /NCGR_PEP_ID=MMETSP1366-20130426/36778_1 /TAXON_ID=38817 /ORGANISM="Gephyrocapsa oceanica, Strain RCC1303" /LENGTH=44 /DNA_ID= /DNA_START= /DNA_END= /DNA_ORIENTATION=